MKPVSFDYSVPENSLAAVEHLKNAQGTAKIVAGNQSLGPMLNLRLVRTDALIDVGLLAEVRKCVVNQDNVFIGAGITHAEIEDGDVQDPTNGWMREAAGNIAYRAVRSRGTIGGSLCHADPAADWLIVLTGLEAFAIVQGLSSNRKLPVENFITGPFTNDLKEDEILMGVEVPKPSAKAKWGYWKFMRQVGEFAKASAVIYHDEHKQITRCAIGALGRQPLLLHNPEKIFDGTLTPANAIKESLPDRDFAEMTMHVTAIERALSIARNQSEPGK